MDGGVDEGDDGGESCWFLTMVRGGVGERGAGKYTSPFITADLLIQLCWRETKKV